MKSLLKKLFKLVEIADNKVDKVIDKVVIENLYPEDFAPKGEHKICINCKFRVENPAAKYLNGDQEKHALCHHPKSLVIDNSAHNEFLVTGKKVEKKPEYRMCFYMRNEHDTCGEEGKLFEEKYPN